MEQLSRLIPVYPGPASDHLYIQAPVKSNYKLCDSDGRVYLEGKENTCDIAHFVYVGSNCLWNGRWRNNAIVRFQIARLRKSRQ